MKLKRHIIFIVGIVLANAGLAQTLAGSNLKKKTIPVARSIQLDSLSIVPGTFFIKGYDTSWYSIDAINATLTLKKIPDTTTMEVEFRVFPYKLNAVSRRYVYDSIRNNFIAQATPKKIGNTGNPQSSFFDFGTMQYNGSFGRSIGFGNSQDVVVNSQFNLQLNGLIGDSIQLAAAITDNNIPIQPDGTTQQLNEFDRVWLQFKKNDWEVNLGDIDLRQNKNYFLNFYKRLQGISFARTSTFSAQSKNKLLLSGAIAKGKFTRNIFDGLEGNQGPYRLRGVNNEIYFIVLAGTERVFIDGISMQRGEDQDYVINYNTAEVTFTPRRMITKDSRIQIEFEYAERSYLNSMLYGSNELTVSKKLMVHLSAYSNADAKNSPINQLLDTKQRAFLNTIGDSVQQALYPNATLDTFSATKILYAQVDTVVNGQNFLAYVYSTNPDSARYNLSFIEVGFGKGNYINLFNGANGKVYQWVAPLNGQPQGNYEPVTFLVTPKKQQVFAAGMVYEMDDKTNITSEIAMSNYDFNALSNKDKSDNKDVAVRIMASRLFPLSSKKGLQLKTSGGYEMAGKNFRPIERLRTPEFYRDWGLQYQPIAANEQLPTANIELKDANNNSVSLATSAYLRSDGYKGFRQVLSNSHSIWGWQLTSAFNITNISFIDTSGYFLRPSVSLSKSLPKLNNFVIGSSYILERNQLKNVRSDTVIASSFSFDVLTAFIKSDPSKDNRWALTYFTRSDKRPFAKQLSTADRSHNISLTTELLANAHHQLRLNATYRQLTVSNSSLSAQLPEKTVLSRAEYVVNEFNGLVVGNILYEVGTGQEQRRDFSYIEVPAGRGEFAWNDYNNDGIPQLNEFEIAIFPDQAKYIRVFTPTNQFVKANYTQFNYSISLNPKSVVSKWKRKKSAAFIGRINWQTSLQTGKKEIANEDIALNPFKGAFSDTSLITLSNVFANTLSFNRFSAKWGLDIGNIINSNKSLLTYGFESRKVNEWTLRGRINPAKQITFEWVQRLGKNILSTPTFANRNYDVNVVNTEPRLTYTAGTNFRIATSYQHIQKKNTAFFGGEKSVNNSLNFESKFNAVNNTSLFGKFTYTNLKYEGLPNSAISYIMLDALLPGKNLLWNFDLTKRLGNNLELSFQYEGRKPAETRTIHIGRASLRAIL